MLHGSFQVPLVLLSIAVAIFASYTALSLAERMGRMSGAAIYAWTAGGAFAMGSGIWAMHFIGMLAFRLPIAVGYDVPLTLLSLLLPIAVSGMALWRVSRPSLDWKALAGSGLLMGLGINTMHYTGMAALRMDPGIVYDPWLFTLSILIAVMASVGALWVGFQLRHNIAHPYLGRVGAAALLGCAIAGMHYTGMAAANIPLGSVCRAASRGVSQDGLAVLVLVATLGILTVALLASVFDARLESNTLLLAASEAASAERGAMLAREREARSQAEGVSALKDEFLATLSHELRTPLNAILGWAVMLRRGVRDDATFQRGLDTIERNARAQASLIDDLLDMSRIIAGKVRLDVQELAPSSFIEAAVATVQPAAIAKNIEIDLELDTGAGPVLGDPSRLQQVMWNLLSNAVKFTPAGGKVRVTLERAQEEVVIKVIDSGVGIAADFIPHVFDRFRQADSSTSRRHGGLGLGLSIAHQLVELHGGTIEVASAGKGAGATFTVSVPLRRADAPVPAALEALLAVAGPGTSALATADLSGVRVLVVDDMTDTLDLAAQVLAASGASVVAAEDAERALAAAKDDAFDVVVSDIGMPGVDGYELARRLRAQGVTAPMIALTAFTREEDRERGMQAGFDGYLRKPLEPGALVAAVAGAVTAGAWTLRDLPLGTGGASSAPGAVRGSR